MFSVHPLSYMNQDHDACRLGKIIESNGVEVFLYQTDHNGGGIKVSAFLYPLREGETTPDNVKDSCRRFGWHFVDEFTEMDRFKDGLPFKRCSWGFKLLPVDPYPDAVFHVTPSANENRIRDSGLRR